MMERDEAESGPYPRSMDAINACRMEFLAGLGPDHPEPRVTAVWSKEDQLHTYVVECPPGCGCEE